MEELRKFLKNWDENISFNFENVIKIGREYFLVNKNVKEFMNKIKLDVFSAGIFLGEMKKKFIPSMALIEMISTDNKIIVDDKTAWLFACGRDIFDTKDVKKEGNSKQVLVLNEKREVFGYAFKCKDRGKYIYKNDLDIGNYLRREKSKR
ncbi:MAG: hypothetical protein AB7V77_00340 [Candidatus Woesearchaeota archaeon]